ncbi:Carboxymuconolactone decarboxylase [Pseudomonas syringae pv. coriandricola]|nr:Carboxymuconolactone decarboxylase [Pseudomonas syringae pv. coriandricola]
MDAHAGSAAIGHHRRLGHHSCVAAPALISIRSDQRRNAMTDNTISEGEQIRRQVMGDVYVDRALGNATDFSQPLQDFVNEHAWGSVWSREGLPLKTRSLITLATLTALKCPQELKGHVRGALNNGCTVEEIREALLHCAVYAGVPAAIDAFRAAQEVIDSYVKPD